MQTSKALSVAILFSAAVLSTACSKREDVPATPPPAPEATPAPAPAVPPPPLPEASAPSAPADAASMPVDPAASAASGV